MATIDLTRACAICDESLEDVDEGIVLCTHGGCTTVCHVSCLATWHNSQAKKRADAKFTCVVCRKEVKRAVDAVDLTMS